MRETFLPVARPWIGEEEKQEVLRTLDSDWITTGPKVQQFERLVADAVGARHAVAVSSCTAALHLALAARGIGPGDEVLISPLTFACNANVVLHQGATPQLVDIRCDTFNMDPDRIEEAITERTRAIIPVHYAGQPADMDAILTIARRYNLTVIEDAAHALGAVYKGRPIGSISDMTAFSFYAIKNITTAEGGMLTTDDEEIAERVRVYSLHGMNRDAWKRYHAEGSWYYEIVYPGYKYNMTDLQAALGIHQVARLKHFNALRARYARMYDEAFADLEEVVTPTVSTHVVHARHLYTILLNIGKLTLTRAEFIQELKRHNIGATVHYVPIHLHPYYRQRFRWTSDMYPNATWVYERTVTLPLYPRMTEGDVRDVIEAVRDIVRGHVRR